MLRKAKKILAASLVMALAGGTFGPVYASELSQKQAELNRIRSQKAVLSRKKNQTESQKKQLVGKLDDVKTQIDQLGNEIRDNEKQLESAQNAVEVTQSQLEEAQANLEQQDSILGQRVRDIYINGKVSYLEVLLESNSFADFLNRFEMMKIVVEKDRQLLADVQEKKDTIADKKKELENKHRQIAQILQTKEMKKNQVEDKQTEYDQMLSQAKKNLVAYEEEISRLEELESKKAAEIIRLKQSQGSKSQATGAYQWPTPGYTRITSPFGWRIHPVLKTRKFHSGVDIGAPSGAKILAAQNGKVIYSGTMNGYGNVVIIDHGAGISTLYAHMSVRLAKVGQEVSKGDVIGKVGATGRVTGPHLHFEVRKNGDPVNPLNYVSR